MTELQLLLLLMLQLLLSSALLRPDPTRDHADTKAAGDLSALPCPPPDAADAPATPEGAVERASPVVAHTRPTRAADLVRGSIMCLRLVGVWPSRKLKNDRCVLCLDTHKSLRGSEVLLCLLLRLVVQFIFHSFFCARGVEITQSDTKRWCALPGTAQQQR